MRSSSRPFVWEWAARSRRTSSSTRACRSGGSAATWLTARIRSTTPSGVVGCSWRKAAACRGPKPDRSPRADSRQFSWSRHGAARSTRSMIAHVRSTQSTDRSRAFQTRPTRPPGRSTRASSAKARSASNQWKAWATQTASREDALNGSASAVPATTGTPGTTRRSTRCICSRGSTATTRAPVGTSSPVSFPVPAARSTTVTPGPRARCSPSQATASGGYDGRERS